MTKIIEAIYADGVLKPSEALELPEQQRVRLIVQVLENEHRRTREDTFKRLRARIAQSKFSYGGPLPSRDEVHERI